MKKLIVIFAFMAVVINLGFTEVSENELKAFEKLCDLKDGEACIAAAFLPYIERKDLSKLTDEKFVKIIQKDSKIFYFSKKACQSKSDKIMDIERKDWCFFIVAAYYYGDEDVNLLQDYSKALYYYEIACEAKHSDGCYWAGVLYHNGQGVKSNKTQAKNYLERLVI